MSIRLTLVWLLAGSAIFPPAASGQARLTVPEALNLAFPAADTIVRRTAFLTESELSRARELAGPGVEIDQALVTFYLARRDSEAIGVAYFDSHRVRTLREVIMVVVTPDSRVERIETLKFSEPPEYEAPAGWLEQFRGRRLDEDLSTKGSIVNITGATLTSRAVTRAVRRVLALNRIILPFEPQRGADTP